MTPHLRAHVRAYVDRALPPALLSLYDRHLICCQSCRAAADQERRMMLTLRSFTGLPTGLRSSLLDLGAQPPAAHPTPSVGPPLACSIDDGSGPVVMPRPLFGTDPALPHVPTPPLGSSVGAHGFSPVPTVSPRSPALHRSPVRAAVVASIAAGASVAAAWGLAVAPLPDTGSPASARMPAEAVGAGQVSSAATVGFSGLTTAGFVVRAAGGARAAAAEARARRLPSGHSASSASVVPSAPRRGSYWVVTAGAAVQPVVTPVRAVRGHSAQSSP